VQVTLLLVAMVEETGVEVEILERPWAGRQIMESQQEEMAIPSTPACRTLGQETLWTISMVVGAHLHVQASAALKAAEHFTDGNSIRISSMDPLQGIALCQA